MSSVNHSGQSRSPTRRPSGSPGMASIGIESTCHKSRFVLKAAPCQIVLVPARRDHDPRSIGLQPRHEIIHVGIPNALTVNVAIGCLATAYRIVDNPEIAAMPRDRAKNPGREILATLRSFPL